MTNSSEVQSSAPSLLAKALGIPSLKHNQKGVGGESSSSSSSGSPSAATPQDFEDAEDRNCDNEQLSSPPDSSFLHLRSMNGFDTPITRNNNNNNNNNHNISSNSNPSPANSAQRPPLGSPFDKTRQTSITSIGESSHITTSSQGTENSSFIQFTDEVPQHSDFTIPISNILAPQTTRRSSAIDTEEPPVEIQQPSLEKRSILGNSVGRKYHCTELDRRPIGRSSKIPIRTTTMYGSIPPPMAVVTTPSTMKGMTPLSSESTSFQQQDDSTTWQSLPTAALHKRSSSRMIPRVLPAKQYPDSYDDYYDDIVDDQNLTCNELCANANGDPELQDLLPKSGSSRRRDFRKSVHAQSLLVGLAFMVVWLPNNAMAPNLTQMAGFYGMNKAERDLYLGSYCALALGVFCLPLSGLIGFMADFYSRKHLFLACCGLGALSAAWTGWAPNYWILFLARLCSGGCMSGSVPVAFSLMGDLFSKEERNAASSGMTSMMGLGILLGQIYAGEVGPSKGWQYPFYVSAFVQLVMLIMIALWVEEPVRGGKEKALQGIFKSGNKYEKQLTMQGFIDAMSKNDSNLILIWQGFVTSLPWGVIFVFLNDYLSQEKGFSVQEATFLVMLFGVGCAIGGVSGGYLGQLFMRGDRRNLPLYMAATTFLGIFPFVALLNSNFPNHNGFRSKFYSIAGGCIANLPSVNIRPCILNVNPPESRGAALTTANLFVTLGRGIGPSFVTLLGSIFSASRQTSFNVSLSIFWTISAIQLLFLANTLPKDQDAMEEELVRYAATAQESNNEIGDNDEKDQVPLSPIRPTAKTFHPKTPDRLDSTRDEENFYDSIISSPPGQYIAIDVKSARESLEFVKLGIQEFGDEIILRNAHCRGCDTISPSDSRDDMRKEAKSSDLDGEVLFSQEEMERRRDMWMRQQQQQQQTD